MTNAFTILGAEPSDSTERLQELLEEKELLLDDVGEAQAAYADLTNPKKRLRHEIVYFNQEDLERFHQLVTKTYSEKPSIVEVADILVDVGRWFEADHEDLLDEINSARFDGGYPEIEDESVISVETEKLKAEYLQQSKSYLDTLTEVSLMKIFNQLVKIGHFESFFIDELIAYYEVTISEILTEKEQKCRAIFGEIETICTQFNNGGPLSESLPQKVSALEEALKDWDSYAQPLQVNAQMRGGQHEKSEELVHDIRNRTVGLCNRSQEMLEKSLKKFEQISLNARYGIGRRGVALHERELLEHKLNDCISFTAILLSLTELLEKVFAELEITAEQLKDDKKQLAGLKDTLTNLRNQIPGAQYRAERNSARSTVSPAATYTTASPSERNGFRILLGILAVICGVLMIVGFSNGNTAMGVAFIILGLAFVIGCGLFYKIKDNKKGLIAIILVPIILILTIVVPIASIRPKSDSSGKSVALNSSNFETYFNITSSGPSSGKSVIVNYSVAPKKTSYASNSNAQTFITVKIKIIVRSSRNTGLNESQIVSLTLNRTSGYIKSGNVTINLSPSTSYSSLYYNTEVASCSGVIYK